MKNAGKVFGNLIFYGQLGNFFVELVNSMVHWYIFPVWVCCTKKNLANAGVNVKLTFFSDSL
jgi:hypothetical protein